MRLAGVVLHWSAVYVISPMASPKCALNNYLAAEQVDFFLGTNQTSVAIYCNMEYLQSALQVAKVGCSDLWCRATADPRFLKPCLYGGNLLKGALPSYQLLILLTVKNHE